MNSIKTLIIAGIFGLIAQTYCKAQQVDTVNIEIVKWVNSFQMGSIIDKNNGLTSRLSTSYLSGVTYGKWTIGAGSGIDDYEYFILVPAIMELKYNLFFSNNSPFVYTFGAYNFLLPKPDVDNYDFKGGIGVGAGVGYSWNLGVVNLFLKSGFQHTRVKSNHQQIYYDVWYSSQFYPQPSQEVTRSMLRAMLQFGINF